MKIKGKVNDLEQYGRRNSIRIYGVPEKGSENAEDTSETVINLLNDRIEDLNLTRENIDIAHRLGDQTSGKEDKKKKPGNRHIIVKFVSRMTREKIISRKKQMKGTHIFIGENLTRMKNYSVLTSMHKNKNHDNNNIKQTWSKNGNLLYKNE